MLICDGIIFGDWHPWEKYYEFYMAKKNEVEVFT